MKAPKPVPASWNHFLHLDPYRLTNSIKGLRLGRHEGFYAADLDQQVTGDGILVCAHWPDLDRNGVYRRSTGKRIAKGLHIADLSMKELSELRSSDGLRIRRTTTIMKHARVLGYHRLELEAKQDKRLQHPETWQDVYDLAQELAFKQGVQVKTLTSIPHGAKRLRAAKAVGFETIMLPRGKGAKSKDAWWPVADYHRGPVTWR